MLLEIESEKNAQWGELRLAGVLDISTVDSFNSSIDNLMGVKELKVNFEKVMFVDSTGIGGVVQVIKKCNEQGIVLRITNISKEVFEILDILGLPEVFGREIFEMIP